MRESLAQEIVSWQYGEEYAVYSMDGSVDLLTEILDGSYYALVDGAENIIGHYCIGNSAQVPSVVQDEMYKADCIDFGLGMNPSLVGRGLGKHFLRFILDCVELDHPGKRIRLTVATFNKRAIKLYENAGFVEVNRFSKVTADDACEFIVMVQNNFSQKIKTPAFTEK